MFTFWLRSPLFDAAAGGEGGGGGAGTGNNPGTFDAAAFRTEMIAEVNKAVNGAVKGLKNEFEKRLPQEGGGEGAGDGGGDGSGEGQPHQQKPDAKTKALETKLQKMQEQLDGEKKAREPAETARRNSDRDTQVQQALAGYRFTDAQAAKDAFEIHRNGAKWAEDGTLVGADDSPLGDWIKGSIEGQRKYLLAPVETGGSGARPGTQKAGGNRPYTLEDIDKISTLKPEEQAALRAQIAQSMQEAQTGL